MLQSTTYPENFLLRLKKYLFTHKAPSSQTLVAPRPKLPEYPNHAYSLDDLLRKLIAAQEGIDPEQVTVEYIRKQRERRFYPSTRYSIGSKYGGYDSTGLIFLTREELEAIERRVDAELAKL